MEEIDIVYSNPIKIDENTLQVDKTCKVIIHKTSLLANKELFESELNRVNNIIDKIKDLF